MKTEYADIIANSFTFGRVYDNIHIIVKAMSDIYSYTGRFSLIIETVGFNGIHKTRNELTKTWTSYMIYSHALTGG